MALRDQVEAAGTVALEQFCQDNLTAIIESLLGGDGTIVQTALVAAGVAPAAATATAETGSALTTLLAGLSTTNATAATAADTILAAIGKLEARMPIAVTLSSAFSSSSSTVQPVPGWTIPVVGGRTYKVQVIATYQSSRTTCGGRLTFGTNTSTGTILGSCRGAITAAAANSELAAPLASPTSGVITTGVSAINIPHYFQMDFIYVCTASGNLPISWGTEVNLVAAQLNAGSTLIYQRLS